MSTGSPDCRLSGDTDAFSTNTHHTYQSCFDTHPNAQLKCNAVFAISLLSNASGLMALILKRLCHRQGGAKPLARSELDDSLRNT